MKLVAVVACLACTAAYGQSVITYCLETGGDDHVAAYQNGTYQTYTAGKTDGSTTVPNGPIGSANLNWAARVTVSGIHSNPGGAGDAAQPTGAANLVFDLQVLQADGTTPVTLGAAPMSCTGGGQPGAGATNCAPTGAGFWSQMNDGALHGVRQNLWANAALTISLSNTASARQYALNDAAPNGPHFDYGWYPTAKGRGGVDFDGSKAIDTTSTAVNASSLAGKLVGFGAGYKSYDYTSYRPGVGLWNVTGDTEAPVQGFGAQGMGDPGDPTIHPNVEKPLFEGQINVSSLPVGTYYLQITPSQDGNNILHGNVNWSSMTPDYGGFGTFAAKANVVNVVDNSGALAATGKIKFVVVGPSVQTQVVARKLFYNNSWFDNNNAGIDTVTTGKCDSNAIDNGGTLYTVAYPAKAPLMLGGGTASFANYSGYTKGINGLIYDVQAPLPRDPVVGDFTFHNIGKSGTTAPAPANLVTPSGFGTIVIATSPARIVRCVVTFADSTVKETWLQVDIGTGFGAPAETHFWGNAAGDTSMGNSPATNLLVGPPDELAARGHPTSALSRSPVYDPFDINKTSLCDPADQLYIRGNNRSSLNCVHLITK